MMKPARKRREMLHAILIALFAALILRQFVIAAYKIPSASMEETLQVGDFLIVSKFIFGARSPEWIGLSYDRQAKAAFPTGFPIPDYLQFKMPGIRDPQPNDIIVFKYPHSPNTDYVKRCIAIGGQTVEQHFGQLLVDGLEFKEPLSLKSDHPERSLPENTTRTSDFEAVDVQPGHLFMMGDNRSNSLDSRNWGLLPDSMIIGKPLFIYLSVTTGDSIGIPRVRWSRLGKVVR